MNAMLTDDELTRLLTEGADAYQVPPEGPAYVVQERGDGPVSSPLLRRRGVQLTAAAAVVVIAAVLAQSSGSTPSLLNKQTAAGAAPPVFATGGIGGTGGTTGGAQGPIPGLPATSPVAGAPQSLTTARQSTKSLDSASAPLGAGPSTVADSGDARVVKTGQLSLVVDDGRVPDTVTRVVLAAKGARGYVADSTSQEFGRSPTASVTLRVPSAGFDALVGAVRALKADVVSQQSSGKDVTATYADTEAQIASLRAARARFLTILAGANTIGETLTVQQRVDDVQGRIDRLEGQRRVLADQSEWATLTVSVGEKADAVLKTSARGGLSKAWDDAKHGFTSGVESLIARSGRAALVLIVFVVGLFVLRIGWRLARRRLV